MILFKSVQWPNLLGLQLCKLEILDYIWTMTSAVNVRSQLIRDIFIFISFIIQCDASNNNTGSKTST